MAVADAGEAHEARGLGHGESGGGGSEGLLVVLVRLVGLVKLIGYVTDVTHRPRAYSRDASPPLALPDVRPPAWIAVPDRERRRLRGAAPAASQPGPECPHRPRDP